MVTLADIVVGVAVVVASDKTVVDVGCSNELYLLTLGNFPLRIVLKGIFDFSVNFFDLLPKFLSKLFRSQIDESLIAVIFLLLIFLSQTVALHESQHSMLFFSVRKSGSLHACS